MKTNTERTDKVSKRIWTVAAGFFCLMGLPMALALGDLHASVASARSPGAVILTEEAPVHSAQAQFDVGPGEDEARLATLPVSH